MRPAIAALIILVCAFPVSSMRVSELVSSGDYGIGAIAALSVSPPVFQPARQYWGTFHYPWYGGPLEGWRHWKENGHGPPSTWASMFLPDDGTGRYDVNNLYSSASPQLIDNHLVQMDRARLDFALVSWWGPHSYEDEVFSEILNRRTLKPNVLTAFAVYYEPEGYSNPDPDALVSNLTYIYDQHSGSSAYFRVSIGTVNLPVVFVSASGSDTVAYVDRWAEARTRMWALGKPIFIDLKVFGGYLAHASKVDGWHQYAPSLRYELQSGYSAFASPGYWEYPELAAQRGRTDGQLLPRDSVAFKNAIDTMASLTLEDATFLLIETWNEWHEGSQIEPGFPITHDETGFVRAGPTYGFAFIDAVRQRQGAVSQPCREDVDRDKDRDLDDLIWVYLSQFSMDLTRDVDDDGDVDIDDLVQVYVSQFISCT